MNEYMSNYALAHLEGAYFSAACDWRRQKVAVARLACPKVQLTKIGGKAHTSTEELSSYHIIDLLFTYKEDLLHDFRQRFFPQSYGAIRHRSDYRDH
jgi:hypothetical protein